MERHANLHEQLFSRGSATPPLAPQSHSFAIRSSSSSPNHLDSLFHSISAQQITESTLHGGSNSAPATPSMAANDDAAPTGSSPPPTAAERQSALLSLLYTSASAAPASSQAPPLPAAPQQVSPPPPPSSSQRAGQSPPNNSEAQGKFLLEQLMAG